ncbi:hypothetical protein B0H13DRAFT_1886132 [Mycena leptocephala]|nr:hypothetical protein B0H13DRAFT_1886132 [Mycena leptocephala]
MVNAARNAHARTRIREQPPGTAPPPPARAAAADESWCWSGVRATVLCGVLYDFGREPAGGVEVLDVCGAKSFGIYYYRNLSSFLTFALLASESFASALSTSAARNIKVQFRAFLGKVCERTSVQSGRDRSPLVPSSEGFPLGGALFCTPSGCRGWGADGAHTVVVKADLVE